VTTGASCSGQGTGIETVRMSAANAEVALTRT